MEDRIYRKLSISDLPLLMQIKNENPEFQICEENARQFLNNPMNWIFACIRDNKIICQIRGYELNNIHNSGNMLYIHAVSVGPQYRRQGFATSMLTKLKETCKLLGIYKIFLFTEKSNIAANGLYKKAGGIYNVDFKDDDDCSIVYTFTP
ncbi:MAG: GNAT family N-acetyltransferase [Oscillospiraceae bacterium]|nr:GNAT family N-acetyltransferase [Oscillospiraceae bacterium]